MSRASRLKTSRTSRKRLTPLQVLLRLFVLAAILGLLAVAGVLVLRSMSQRGEVTSVQLDLDADPSLNPVEAAALKAYLTLNQDALNAPISDDTRTVVFEISPGQNAGQIADNLVAQGLIDDTTLFRNYLRYYGLDRQLEAGTYQLSPSMPIPEIALALSEATPPEVTIQIPEGWRREQIADWIEQQPDIPFGGMEFLAASGAGVTRPPEASIAGEIPPDAALEGFLFPDTYRVATDATAADLVAKMLRNLDAQVTPQMRVDAAAQGMTFYEVVTLASIVEREAIIAEEQPTIASVFLNRLRAGMMLQADPTVQYAMGYQADSGEWWNLNLTQDDYTGVESPYNTYLYEGLPPGPIANPGLSAIQAVIYPADTPYLYFRAACDGSGRHTFAVTFEEHVANACP